MRLLLASPRLGQIFWWVPDDVPTRLCFINANDSVQCHRSPKCQQKPLLGETIETLAY